MHGVTQRAIGVVLARERGFGASTGAEEERHGDERCRAESALRKENRVHQFPTYEAALVTIL
jgi:hypothetical protein